MSAEAEQAVLAACVMSPIARTEAKRRITGNDFDNPQHEVIWDAIGVLERHGKGVDWVTLREVLATKPNALALLPELITSPLMPSHVNDYADVIRDKATLRRLRAEAERALQQATAGGSGKGLAAKFATRFAAIRDGGLSTDDMSALTLREVLTIEDAERDWVIPDLLERRDRLILTGEEGLGKSHLLRQIVVYGAAGLHPFRYERIKPIKAVVFDCENTPNQVRRGIRAVTEHATLTGQDPRDRVTIDCIGRIDLTADKELARIHQVLDATQPEVVVIGPLYRLIPRSIYTDEAVAPLLAALDSIRDRGAALMIEGHAGHGIGQTGSRDLRPRGSSALLGWPEFGYGMRNTGFETCELVPWRGDRESRQWPKDMQRDTASHRWLPKPEPFGRTA